MLNLCKNLKNNNLHNFFKINNIFKFSIKFTKNSNLQNMLFMNHGYIII